MATYVSAERRVPLERALLERLRHGGPQTLAELAAAGSASYPVIDSVVRGLVASARVERFRGERPAVAQPLRWGRARADSPRRRVAAILYRIVEGGEGGGAADLTRAGGH